MPVCASKYRLMPPHRQSATPPYDRWQSSAKWCQEATTGTNWHELTPPTRHVARTRKNEIQNPKTHPGRIPRLIWKRRFHRMEKNRVNQAHRLRDTKTDYEFTNGKNGDTKNG